MVDRDFAQRFVEKIHKQLGYNINVMDDHGIIIASTKPDRIGDFHMCAYEIFQKKLPVMSTEELSDKLIGVKQPGVNLLVSDGSEPIGVIGVSGDPRSVFDAAQLIKLTFEAMLVAENQRTKLFKNRHCGQFAYVLLFEHPQNIASIHKKAEIYGFQDNCPRIPIIIQMGLLTNSEQCVQQLLDHYPNLSIYNRQDILFDLDGNRVMLFKTITKDWNDYRQYAETCIAELDRFLTQFTNEIPSQACYFCGTVQQLFINYSTMHDCLYWLESHQKNTSAHVNFFVDFLTEYLVEHVSRNLLSPIFDSSVALIEEKLDAKYFTSTVHALIDSNMKLDAAAQALYMHKNTVVYHLKKIKEVLGIDPINNARDAAYLIMLYDYWERYI